MGVLPARMPPVDIRTPAQPLVHPCLQIAPDTGSSGYFWMRMMTNFKFSLRNSLTHVYALK